MSKNLIIVGDSNFAQIAFEYFSKDSDYEVKAFAVEKDFRNKDQLFNLPVVNFETLEQNYDPKSYEIFVAITYIQLNRVRARLCKDAKSKGYKLANYISSKAFVWDNVKLGDNVFIFEDNTVQPFVMIGDNVILWSGNHIGHHSTIGNDVFISSHVVISGHCAIADNCFIGVNSAIGNNINIASDNFIAQGAVIFKSTEEDGFYEGNPAQKRTVSAKRLCKVKG